MTKDEILQDVFTTAIESGVYYWFVVTEYRWEGRGNDYFATGKIVDEDGEEQRIDRATVVRGIRRAYADRGKIGDKYQRTAISDLNYGHWDDVDYDAITADIVIQYGLLNDLIYG